MKNILAYQQLGGGGGGGNKIVNLILLKKGCGEWRKDYYLKLAKLF